MVSMSCLSFPLALGTLWEYVAARVLSLQHVFLLVHVLELQDCMLRASYRTGSSVEPCQCLQANDSKHPCLKDACKPSKCARMGAD